VNQAWVDRAEGMGKQPDLQAINARYGLEIHHICLFFVLRQLLALRFLVLAIKA